MSLRTPSKTGAVRDCCVEGRRRVITVQKPRAVGLLPVCLTVKPVGEPDALIGHVRFDERGWETERCRIGPSYRAHPRLYHRDVSPDGLVCPQLGVKQTQSRHCAIIFMRRLGLLPNARLRTALPPRLSCGCSSGGRASCRSCFVRTDGSPQSACARMGPRSTWSQDGPQRV